MIMTRVGFLAAAAWLGLWLGLAAAQVDDDVCIHNSDGNLRSIAGHAYCRERHGEQSLCLGIESYCCSDYAHCNCAPERVSGSELCGQSVQQVARTICTGRGIWLCTSSSPTSVAPTTTPAPTAAPTQQPSATPTPDPCHVHTCSHDCEGIEQPGGAPAALCGWDRDAAMCVTGRVTTAEERRLFLESGPRGCAHHTLASTVPPPSATPTARRVAPSGGGGAAYGGDHPAVGADQSGQHLVIKSARDGGIFINGVDWDHLVREHRDVVLELAQLRQLVAELNTTRGPG